jgi:hypothetical protein
MKTINVLKANGEIVPFDPDKIRRSLRRVKAKSSVIDRVIKAVEQTIYDGIPTSKLFKIVFSELRKEQKLVAGKYNLKRTIMELGPSGFPFEKFIAAIWKADGYSVTTGITVKGECVSHEVDVIAKRDKLQEFIECKHHSFGGKICDIKTALYVHARFLDLEKKQRAGFASPKNQFKGWLITNTRFTADAIKYGPCAGLNLLSWDFPPKNGLRERIDRAGLHPITSLTSIPKNQKKRLMDRGITLCSDLGDESGVLQSIGIQGDKAIEVLEEASSICKIPVRK